MTSCVNGHSLVYPNLATTGKTLNNCPTCGEGRIKRNLRARQDRKDWVEGNR